VGQVRGLAHHAALDIEVDFDVDLVAGREPAACRLALLRPSR
jgi:hypothetical protein